MLPVLMVVALSFVGAAVVQSRYRSEIGQLLLASWAFHVLAALANGYLIYYIYGRGDPMIFHKVAKMVAELIDADPGQYLPGVVRTVFGVNGGVHEVLQGKSSTVTIKAMASIVCWIIGDSYWAISMVFGLGGYFAKVAVFEACRRLFPGVSAKHLVYATCLMPSVVFWSAGIIKECVVLMGFGLCAIGVRFGLERRLILSLAFLGLGLYFVVAIKSFILMCIVVSLSAWLYWRRAVGQGQIKLRPFTLLLVVVTGLGGLFLVGSVFPRFALDSLVDQTINSQAKGYQGGSKFSVGIGGGGPIGLMLSSPFGLFAGWFRPSLLDVRNPQMLVNAMETTALMGLLGRTMYRGGINAFWAAMTAHPHLAGFITFAITMGVGTGLATSNLGTLSRYRMPLVPFLAVSTVVYWHYQRQTARAAVRPIRRVQIQRAR